MCLATGTNRDRDAAQALELAGATPEIVPLKQLRQDPHSWHDYQMLVVAGGFSYADALGAGKLLALDLQHYFADQASRVCAAASRSSVFATGSRPWSRPGHSQGVCLTRPAPAIRRPPR